MTEDIKTVLIGTIATPPDEDGWQVTYEIGLQGEPGELVVMSATERSHVGIPRGGLTAQRGRSLLKPGLAVREFTRAVMEGTATRQMTLEEATAFLEDPDANRPWQAEPTREFVEYTRWLQALPALRRLTHGPWPDRRRRIVETAGLYVMAVQDGDSSPRKRVAAQQERAEAAVRDDLHAARHERPAFLTVGGKGRAGGVLTEAARALLQETP